ncbi:MAG: Gfo/Idh/MocA family oxidoreductase [Propionibacteriales bacterium]|nr:Gfo/Idh/MocA family oxidoreductase [Propionibacteriales bacterium]
MTTQAPLRAGVVGLGWAGDQHMRGYAAAPEVELVAMAGMESDKLEELGEQYGVAGRYANLESMLADADLDVVSIATPTALHAPMTITALDHGVHVLTEKPMAENVDSARAMVAAARRNNRVLEVTFNKRRAPEVTALAQLVADGVLGTIYYAKAGWVRRQGIPGIGSWFTQRAMAGGGALMDIGIHALDMALHVMGEPVPSAVSGATYAEFGPRGRGGARGAGSHKWSAEPVGSPESFEVEDLGTAFVRMDGGATLLLEASWAQWIEEDSLYLSVYGTDGGAQLHLPAGQGQESELIVHTDVKDMPAVITPTLGPAGDHVDCVRDFVLAVRSGEWDQHGGAVGLTRAEIVDACYASARQGSEVVIG